MNKKFLKSLIILICFSFIASFVFAEGKKEEEKKITERCPAPPPYDSAGIMPDEGTVKPIDKMPDKPLRIAFLGLEVNPFCIRIRNGVIKAKEELEPYNCEVDWLVPGESHLTEYFGPGLETAMAQGYDAIVTMAGEAGTVPYIDKVVEAGIPVATWNSETEMESKRLFFVGADCYKQALVLGEKMVKELGGKGKVAIITGFFAVESHEDRRIGLHDYLKEHAPDIKIVGEVENLDKAAKAYEQAMDFMTAHPDLSAIYVTAGGPFGAAKAVEDAGKAGKVKIFCYDFVDETMEFVEKGVITGTIGQNPFAQGHDPVIRLFNYLVACEVPPYGKLLTEAAYCTQENVDQYWGK